jgi:nitrate/TMAO reductase-like tetraheme cytochrome c subunit
MKFIKRLLLSLFIALPVLGVLLLFSQTRASAEPGSPPQPGDCAACHQEYVASWHSGKHASAGRNPAFLAAWAAQGQPGACLTCHAPDQTASADARLKEGVSCQACHGPVLENHPTENMPVDTSGQLCAKCHSDPSFGDAWSSSAHYQTGMPCTTCHNPHTNGFKAAPGEEAAVSQNPSILCENCHKDIAATAEHSKHTAANVACVDCHLGVSMKDPSNPHLTPNHSFKPTLDTCESCHSTQMHTATGAAVSAQGTGDKQPAGGEANTVAQAALFSGTPSPVSPLGYAVIALLVGLAGGFALAPLLERNSRRRNGGK